MGYDPASTNYLVNGFQSGFAIGCLNVPSQTEIPNNLLSATQYPGIIESKIVKELAAGRIIGPLSSPPAINKYRVSPLGVVPKKKPGEFRMIHHLSYPPGYSVNDHIPTELSAVKYATIQDAVSHITKCQNVVYMAKVDIESAFRIIPVRPADRPLLGFKWRDSFYMDAVLPMGCSSSCAIFEYFSRALEWVAENRLGISKVVHVIDDFLFLADSFEKCLQDLNAFMSMCAKLGVPLAPEKTMGPSSVLPFLGITLDTVRMEARLPDDKITKCRGLLHEFNKKTKLTLKELQSLLGILNFACSVIVPGRPFLRRTIDLTIGIARPHHHIRLTKEAKLDMLVWSDFLCKFNNKSFFINDNVMNGDVLQLYTDASGGIGYGALYGTKWFYGQWPRAWLQYNITVLEFFPIVAAVTVWGHDWSNHSVCFITDNEALVHIINQQTSKDKKVMSLLRKLVLLCLTMNINFTAKHIAGKKNTLADKLSRSQINGFKTLAPWADKTPTPLPVSIRPDTLGTL